VIVYHVTSAANASAIEREGFKDSRGLFLSEAEHAGVWVAGRALDVNELGGIVPEATFEVELEESEIAEFEWIEEGKPYREWLVPAAVLNSARRRRVD
jgi:hypothetical protein